MNTQQHNPQTANQVRDSYRSATHAEPHQEAGAPAINRGATGGSWKIYAATGVLLLAGFKLFGGGQGPWKGAENEAPNYKHHLAAAASTTQIGLSSSDINQKLTRQAMTAVSAGTIIPELKGAHPQLLEKIAGGEVKFYSMKFWDTCAEDGDHVAVQLDNGMQFGPFPLTHDGKTLAIPVADNAPPQIRLIAVKDGVGGVTVGVTTSSGVWYSNVIPEGAHQDIPSILR